MEQINTYILQARQQGQTDEQIRQALISSGWNADQVNNALGVSGSQSTPAPINLSDLSNPSQLSSNPQPGNISNPQVFNQAPIVGATQTSNTASQQNMPTKRKSKLPLVIVGIVILLLIIGGGAFALLGHKTSYQTVIQNFVTAVQNKDKSTVDSLESPAAKTYFQNNAGTTSFYDACQQAGAFCTDSFSASYLAKATKTYKSYTAANGTKGEQLTYTINQSLSGSQAGGQGCSSNSTSTLTIAVVPKGNSWLVDNVSEGSNASANLCPVSGGTSSVGD